ncbi:hypothetical protein PAPYR_1288 [Paratrimastix pyriformis]|uniref:Uncharacterized protein n=1 Tax=Paratrimastix pyriformis TaxID=342808 RepID=A0ABQ8UX21_9EUKA|nr:hypothetical protein PAPYR_1288 [Paratrimastix pyriformis]
MPTMLRSALQGHLGLNTAVPQGVMLDLARGQRALEVLTFLGACFERPDMQPPPPDVTRALLAVNQLDVVSSFLERCGPKLPCLTADQCAGLLSLVATGEPVFGLSAVAAMDRGVVTTLFELGHPLVREQLLERRDFPPDLLPKVQARTRSQEAALFRCAPDRSLQLQGLHSGDLSVMEALAANPRLDPEVRRNLLSFKHPKMFRILRTLASRQDLTPAEVIALAEIRDFDVIGNLCRNGAVELPPERIRFLGSFNHEELASRRTWLSCLRLMGSEEDSEDDLLEMLDSLQAEVRCALVRGHPRQMTAALLDEWSDDGAFLHMTVCSGGGGLWRTGDPLCLAIARQPELPFTQQMLAVVLESATWERRAELLDAFLERYAYQRAHRPDQVRPLLGSMVALCTDAAEAEATQGERVSKPGPTRMLLRLLREVPGGRTLSGVIFNQDDAAPFAITHPADTAALLRELQPHCEGRPAVLEAFAGALAESVRRPRLFGQRPFFPILILAPLAGTYPFLILAPVGLAAGRWFRLLKRHAGDVAAKGELLALLGILCQGGDEDAAAYQSLLQTLIARLPDWALEDLMRLGLTHVSPSVWWRIYARIVSSGAPEGRLMESLQGLAAQVDLPDLLVWALALHRSPLVDKFAQSGGRPWTPPANAPVNPLVETLFKRTRPPPTGLTTYLLRVEPAHALAVLKSDYLTAPQVEYVQRVIAGPLPSTSPLCQCMADFFSTLGDLCGRPGCHLQCPVDSRVFNAVLSTRRIGTDVRELHGFLTNTVHVATGVEHVRLLGEIYRRRFEPDALLQTHSFREARDYMLHFLLACEPREFVSDLLQNGLLRFCEVNLGATATLFQATRQAQDILTGDFVAKVNSKTCHYLALTVPGFEERGVSVRRATLDLLLGPHVTVDVILQCSRQLHIEPSPILTGLAGFGLGSLEVANTSRLLAELAELRFEMTRSRDAAIEDTVLPRMHSDLASGVRYFHITRYLSLFPSLANGPTDGTASPMPAQVLTLTRVWGPDREEGRPCRVCPANSKEYPCRLGIGSSLVGQVLCDALGWLWPLFSLGGTALFIGLHRALEAHQLQAADEAGDHAQWHLALEVPVPDKQPHRCRLAALEDRIFAEAAHLAQGAAAKLTAYFAEPRWTFIAKSPVELRDCFRTALIPLPGRELRYGPIPTAPATKLSEVAGFCASLTRDFDLLVRTIRPELLFTLGEYCTPQGLVQTGIATLAVIRQVTVASRRPLSKLRPLSACLDEMRDMGLGGITRTDLPACYPRLVELYDGFMRTHEESVAELFRMAGLRIVRGLDFSNCHEITEWVVEVDPSELVDDYELDLDGDQMPQVDEATGTVRKLGSSNVAKRPKVTAIRKTRKIPTPIEANKVLTAQSFQSEVPLNHLRLILSRIRTIRDELNSACELQYSFINQAQLIASVDRFKGLLTSPQEFSLPGGTLYSFTLRPEFFGGPIGLLERKVTQLHDSEISAVAYYRIQTQHPTLADELRRYLEALGRFQAMSPQQLAAAGASSPDRLVNGFDHPQIERRVAMAALAVAVLKADVSYHSMFNNMAKLQRVASILAEVGPHLAAAEREATDGAFLCAMRCHTHVEGKADVTGILFVSGHCETPGQPWSHWLHYSTTGCAHRDFTGLLELGSAPRDLDRVYQNASRKRIAFSGGTVFRLQDLFPIQETRDTCAMLYLNQQAVQEVRALILPQVIDCLRAGELGDEVNIGRALVVGTTNYCASGEDVNGTKAHHLRIEAALCNASPLVRLCFAHPPPQQGPTTTAALKVDVQIAELLQSLR